MSDKATPEDVLDHLRRSFLNGVKVGCMSFIDRCRYARNLMRDANQSQNQASDTHRKIALSILTKAVVENDRVEALIEMQDRTLEAAQ